MPDPIITAAVEHCWQEEQLAHAEWFYGKTEAQRREIQNNDAEPWRSIMRVSLLRLIASLEEAGHYDNSPLHGPAAQKRKPAVYQYSPYDYEIARRVESMTAEKQWGKRDV